MRSVATFAVMAIGAVFVCGCDVRAQGENPEIKRIALSTGVELEYLEQGNPTGDPVIFIPGFTDTKHTFDLNLPSFPRRYHVFALDMRGHGDSSKPTCCYTHQDFAADVLAFMDAQGLKKASLVGASLGGFVAHLLAVTAPERVDRLVVIGTAGTAAGNPPISGADQWLSSITELPAGFVDDWVGGFFVRPVPQEFLNTQLVEAYKVPFHVWQLGVKGLLAEDHTAQLSQIKSPTLIIYGDRDGVFSVDQMFSLQAAIPDARLYIYTNAGHAPYADVPRRANCDIVRFLDGINSDPGPIVTYTSDGTDDCKR